MRRVVGIIIRDIGGLGLDDLTDGVSDISRHIAADLEIAKGRLEHVAGGRRAARAEEIIADSRVEVPAGETFVGVVGSPEITAGAKQKVAQGACSRPETRDGFLKESVTLRYSISIKKSNT